MREPRCDSPRPLHVDDSILTVGRSRRYGPAWACCALLRDAHLPYKDEGSTVIGTPLSWSKVTPRIRLRCWPPRMIGPVLGVHDGAIPPSGRPALSASDGPDHLGRNEPSCLPGRPPGQQFLQGRRGHGLEHRFDFSNRISPSTRVSVLYGEHDSHWLQIRSGRSTVLASSTFPVLRVVAGSKSRTCTSSSATGRCSTPRGT